MKKGEIVPTEIEILPSSTYFKQGETLVVVIKGNEIIKGTSSPGLSTRYEHHETVNKGHHYIHTGANYDSHHYPNYTSINKSFRKLRQFYAQAS